MLRRAALGTIAWIAAQAAAPALRACTLCDGGTGGQVRAGILDGNFGGTLAAVLLPFPILLGVVAVIHFGWPFPRRAPRAGSRRRPHGREDRP